MSDATQERLPRVWLLRGDKGGDNAQMDAVADGLPWPVEVHQLRFRPGLDLKKPFFNASVRHLEAESAAALSAPWPDLIITCGRRLAMAALWVQAQSGGRTRLVLIGRPKRWLHVWDLIVASAQYQLPHRDNVVALTLPLIDVNREALQAAQSAGAALRSAHPTPLTALMLGGITRPYRLDVEDVLRMIESVQSQRPGGTVYLTTSRRTPRALVDELVGRLPERVVLHDWHSDAANPYLALLAAADHVVVTGDSISMLTEAVRTGHVVEIAELRKKRDVPGMLVDRILGGTNWETPSVWQRACARLGIASFPRNLENFHQALYAAGLARPLGAALERSDNTVNFSLLNDVARVSRRIVALLPNAEAHLPEAELCPR